MKLPNSMEAVKGPHPPMALVIQGSLHVAAHTGKMP